MLLQAQGGLEGDFYIGGIGCGQGYVVGVGLDLIIVVNGLPTAVVLYSYVFQCARRVVFCYAALEGLTEGIGNERKLLPDRTDQYDIELVKAVGGMVSDAV